MTKALEEFFKNNNIKIITNKTKVFQRDIPVKTKIDYYNFLKLNYGEDYASNTLKEEIEMNIGGLLVMYKLEVLK